MAKASKKRTMTTYTTYNWTDHDPLLDWFATAKSDSGKSDAEISAETRVTRGTLRRYESGDTKWPKLTTLAACAVAVGAEYLPLTAKTRREYKVAKK